MNVQRFKGVLYILAGVVTWFFVRTILEWLIAQRFFPTPNFILDMGDLFYHIAGLVVALGVILGLLINLKSRVFIDEVSVETSKVTWPGMRDTVNATIVVTIAIILAGFLFGAMDWTIGVLFKWVIERLFK